MEFMNLKEAKKVYTKGFMKDNIENLEEFDAFHCLLASKEDTIEKTKKVLKYIPKQYEEWLKYCDGGMLFDIDILTAHDYSDDEIDFDNLEENNNEETYNMVDLPKGYVIFALESTGNVFCFNLEEKDEKVYLWNIEEKEFTDIWDTFEDWITEEIDIAIEMIGEDVIQPLDIKL